MEIIGDAFLRVTGPCYVALGVTLIAAVAHLLLTVILPTVARDSGDVASPSSFLAHAATFFVFFNILFNYVMCVRRDPGSPTSKDVQLMCAEAGAAVRRWCHKCRCPKPELAHHCNVCRRCVLKMDHHCPWMNNCVGHRNYRYFFNFLAWLWVGCLVTAVVAGDALFDFSTAPVDGNPTTPSRTFFDRLRAVDVEVDGGVGGVGNGGARGHGHGLNSDEKKAALFSFFLACSIFCAMCLMWWWHVYLVLTAQTTIDYYSFREKRREARARGETFRNPHDLGWVRNWQETFDERGKYWWVTWAAPRLKPHRGTGVPIAPEA